MATRRLSIVTWLSIGVLAALLWLTWQARNASRDIAVASPTAAASHHAPLTVRCTAETGNLPAVVSSDPCPGAIAAIEAAVAKVELPIDTIVIEPGPFYCDIVWPGIWSPVPCRGFPVQPGQFMHAWVSFDGSVDVAAVMLGLDLPDDLDAAGATRPPWQATVVTVQTPPDGWVMP